MDLSQILSSFGFDWRVALANLVNFLVIVWVLEKFAFKSISQKIKERQDVIDKSVEDAKKSSTELQMAQQTSDKIITEAKNQANKIVALSQKESEKLISDAKTFQEEQSKQIIEKAERVILQEKNKMIQEIKKETIELVLNISKKFIANNSTKENQEEVIKKIIKENEL